jgi:predicted esterase
MIKNEILVTKKASYYSSQKPSQSINQVWIICHGYGQLAEYFLEWFTPVFSEKTLIVAPEGLHRFYINGFSGRVGASWMTKQDRLNDIEDYVNYLDEVYLKIKNMVSPSCFIHVLGFSQGVSTAIRWICKSKLQVNSLSLFSGKIPEDIDYKLYCKKINTLNPKIIFGNNDEFYSTKTINDELNFIKSNGLNFKYIEFDGGHKVKKNIITKLGTIIDKELIKKNKF